MHLPRNPECVPDMHERPGCPPSRIPRLALTAAASDPDSRLRWVAEQAEAVEFSPDPDRLERVSEMIAPFLRAGLPVRFHTRYFAHELGHADPIQAGMALDAHIRTLRAMSELGQRVVTVHTGLDPRLPVHEATLMENLARLVDRGEGLGVAVCLENLRVGPSSEPGNVLRWAVAAGARITLDVGHALGSAAVRDGRCPVEGFVDLFADRLMEVHIYGREDDQGHHPIEDIAPFRPLIERLLHTRCAWWTVELQRPDHAQATRTLLVEELTGGGSRARCPRRIVPSASLSLDAVAPAPVAPRTVRHDAPNSAQAPTSAQPLRFPCPIHAC